MVRLRSRSINRSRIDVGRRHRRRNSDNCMESDKRTISERMGVLETGSERSAGVGAGGKGPLRMKCCRGNVWKFNSIRPQQWCR